MPGDQWDEGAEAYYDAAREANAAAEAAAEEEVQCPACRGQGVIRKWPGDRSPEQDCEYCGGSGVTTQAGYDAYQDKWR